jgi:hypothetical protein
MLESLYIDEFKEYANGLAKGLADAKLLRAAARRRDWHGYPSGRCSGCCMTDEKGASIDGHLNAPSAGCAGSNGGR